MDTRKSTYRLAYSAAGVITGLPNTPFLGVVPAASAPARLGVTPATGLRGVIAELMPAVTAGIGATLAAATTVSPDCCFASAVASARSMWITSGLSDDVEAPILGA